MRPEPLALLLLAAMTPTAGAQRLPWAGHWKLDETSGTTARDSAFWRNDGQLVNFTGNPWVTGKIGGALAFDGVDDHVAIGIKSALPIYDGRGSPYAVTFWVKAPAQNDKRVYSEGNSMAANGFGALFTIGTGRTANGTADRVQVFIRNDNTQNVINWQSNAVAFDDKWHHVAWSDVAGMGQLWIDGVRDTRSWDYTGVARSPRTSGYGAFTMDRVAIGAVLRNAVCCALNGTVDDLRVFATSLTDADVKAIMNGGTVASCRASVGLFGFGCGPGPLALAAGGSAKLGGTLTMQLQQGTPNHLATLLIGGALAPVDLPGLPGCRLYTPLRGLLTVPIGTIDAQGSSIRLPLRVPNNPFFVCQTLSFQGATLGGTPRALALSNGASVLFGN